MITPKEYREMEFVGVMVELAKLFKPKVYVELGVRKGHTLAKMLPHVDHAIGVDLKHQHKLSANNLTLLSMATEEYSAILLEAKQSPFIDFLFIDADHKAEAVYRDFWDFLPFVKPITGLIFLHDTHPINADLMNDEHCGTAWQAAEMLRIRHKNQFEMITFPGPWAGMTIIRDSRYPAHHWLSWKERS